jgi:hypothetical protein
MMRLSSVIRVLFVCTLVLCACAAPVASPQPAPDIPSEAPSETPFAFPTTSLPPDPIRTVGTPHIDQGPDGPVTAVPAETQNCGYQWAYQDLPGLSSNVQQSLQALEAGAQAQAFAFGENCLLRNGTVAGFTAMETDFNVTIPVEDLANEDNLGEWIVKVMQVIEGIPPEQIVGPRPGRVSILFQSDTTQGGVNFYRDQYQALPPGLSNAEIYRALQTP